MKHDYLDLFSSETADLHRTPPCEGRWVFKLWAGMNVLPRPHPPPQAPAVNPVSQPWVLIGLPL